MDYESSDAVIGFIEEHYTKMGVFTEPMGEAEAPTWWICFGASALGC